MDSDSEREKSSDPNDLTSSEDKTFLDDDDDDLDDSSDMDIDESSLLNKKREKVKNVNIMLSAKVARVAENLKNCKVSLSETDKSHSRGLKVIKIRGNLIDSSDSDSDLWHIGDNKLKTLSSAQLNAKRSCEAIEVCAEIDDNSQLQVREDGICKSNTSSLGVASNFSKSDSDVEMKDLPNESSARVEKTNSIPNENPNAFPNENKAATNQLNAPKILESKFIDGEGVRGSVRESIEYFYSAQDLLECGHFLSNDLWTPDMESGYFEKSESDISRDDNEATTSKVQQIYNVSSKPPSKPQRDRSMSEGLRIELNRFNSMMEKKRNSMEKKRITTNEELKQEAIDESLILEAIYSGNEKKDHQLIDDLKDKDPQRGYWSTVFGQASQIDPEEELSVEHSTQMQKAHRALELLEDYHSRLSEPQDRALRIAIERVIRIFKSRLFQALLARDFMQAYRHQLQCVQTVVRMLQQLKEENWCLPVMYTVCLDLRILAQRCEELGRSSKPGEILEKAADCLMACFRVCAADNRSSDDDTKRLGMLNLVNQLFKVYFRINKLHLCKPLIRAIDSSAFKETFPLPEQITYKYFVGRKAMFDSDYKSADEFLSFALKNCPRNFPRNKRLILIYLVPVKMLLGYMPNKKILERYDILQFHELTVALKEGNVRKFDEVIQRHEIFFIKCGIYLLVEKLKFIAYRNLFKKVYLIKQTYQLDMGDFCAALQFVGETDMSIDETHCIVANLIFESKIKGYISHSHNKLVVSKQNPFPPLNTVS